MIVPLFAARYLGKEVFGKATLAITVGQFLSIIMLLGMNNAVVRYGAPRQYPREEVGAAILVTIVATFGTILTLYLGGGAFLTQTFRFEETILNWGVVFALFATAYVLTTSFLQSFHIFYERGVGELLAALSVVIGFATGIGVLGRHFAAYVVGTCLAFFVATAYSVWHSCRHLGRVGFPARRTLSVMSAYGILSTLGNVGFVLTFYFQPMLLNKLMSVGELGVFRVYQTASITIAQSLSVIFNTVFFPKASASSDRRELWCVTWRLWLIALVPLGVAYVVSQFLLIPLAGKDYPLDWSLIGVFAITSLVITVQSTVGQFLGAEGVRGVAAGLGISMVTGLTCLGLTYVLVPALHLTGACLALLISYAIALVLVIFAEEHILRQVQRATRPIPERECFQLRPFEPHSASEILPEGLPPTDDVESDSD